MRRIGAFFFTILFITCSGSVAFPTKASMKAKGQMATYRSSTIVQGATGGWGIGNSRDMVPEEFAKRGDRKAFEGYKITDRGEFMRQVKQDQDDLRKQELEELLGCAKIAGIDVERKVNRLNKFEADLLNDDDEDDLDVSV